MTRRELEQLMHAHEVNYRYAAHMPRKTEPVCRTCGVLDVEARGVGDGTVVGVNAQHHAVIIKAALRNEARRKR